MRSLLLMCSLFLLACPPSDANELCGAGATLPTAPTALVTGKKMKNLALAGNALVYVDTEGTGSIHRVGLDGSGDTVLYGPPAQGKLVFDSVVVDDTVWFFEQESLLLGGTTTRLLHLPVAGGAVVSADLPETAVYFLRPEAGAFYVKSANSGSAMSTVFLMTSTGALTKLVGPGNVDNALVTADSLFFLNRPDIGADASSKSLRRAAKEANATDSAVGSVFCRGSFTVTASGAILCSGYTSTGTGSPSSAVVTKLDAAGTNPTTLLDLKAGFSGSGVSAAAEVGDEIIFGLSGTGETYPLLAVKLATGAARALACDVAPPERDNGNDRPELVTNADSVFWIGNGERGTGPNTLFKASLR
ncbi:MAG: hypothetical protein Q8L48_06720 [Archangium sp.]|nr:hypothetical protein [Archangium sp.]